MPEAKRRQAKAMFEKGLGYKAVARLIELNVYTVRDWGREFKAGKFRVSDTELGDAATVVDLREDQILDLRRQGFDDRTIALRIGLSLQTVRRYLRRPSTGFRKELETVLPVKPSCSLEEPKV